MANVIDLSGGGTTAQQDGEKRVSYPFLVGESPDAYPRIIERDYVMLQTSYAPTLATRTSYGNQILRSRTFANATWTSSAATATDAAAANPNDGTLTASTLMETAATAEHYVLQAFTFGAIPYFFGVWAKPNGRNYIRLGALDSAMTFFSAFFNLSTGAAGTTSGGATASIINAGNGWYYCRLIFTPAAGVASGLSVTLSTDGSTTSYLGDTTKGAYLYNATLSTSADVMPDIATTTALASISAPNNDYMDNGATDTNADLFAYLVAESAPAPIGGGFVRFTRTYARIPATQYEPSSQLVVRPVMNDVKSGSTYAATFDGGATSHLFSSRISVSSIAAPDVPTTANPANGATAGTLPHVLISVTANSGTNTFYADDSDATIKDAMSNAATGSTASAANFKILRNIGSLSVYCVTTNITISALSSAGASVVVTPGLALASASGGTATKLFDLNSSDANANSTRTVTTGSAHSGAAGGWFAAWNGDKLIGVSKAVSASGSTMEVPLVDFQGSDLALTHIAFASQASVRVVNGAVDCSARLARRFYLTGVSDGIANRADIPTYTPAMDPVSWLATVVAYIAAPSEDTYAIESTDSLKRWNGFSILEKAVSEIQVKDAYVTASVSA